MASVKDPQTAPPIPFSAEMRIFWLLLVLLLGVFGVMLSASLPITPLLFAAALLALAGVSAFRVSYEAARSKRDSAFQGNELGSIIRGLEDAFVAYDGNFRVLFFNPSAEKLFGVEAKAVVGHEIKPQDAEKPEWRLLTQVIFPSLAPAMAARSPAGQYPQVVDISFEDPALELQVTTSPISDEKGALLGFMKIIRNRTLELSLIRAQSEFIAVASHQLRTPVNEINWAIESLRSEKKAPADENSKALIESVANSSRHLLALIENLLNISKISEGRFGFQFTKVNLVEFLENALQTVMPDITRAGLKLYFDRPKGPVPPVAIDAQKIGMVLSNLLDNAIHYNVPGGQITVGVQKSERGPFLQVSVKDTGIGVPEDQMNKLFTKFFRGSTAMKFKIEGTGLGLYIAKNIVRAHGGQMWAESELERGSTFYFTLPTDPTLVPIKEVPIEY